MDEDLAKAMEEEMARAMAPTQKRPDSEVQRNAMEEEMAMAMGASSPKSADFDAQRRAMLSIKTPVTVTLARKRESLQRILDLIPGSMLTFDTHCDEPLTLEAGGHPIATGETIKIGDKFGLRIREIIDYSAQE